jgi:hypothetical protein
MPEGRGDGIAAVLAEAVAADADAVAAEAEASAADAAAPVDAVAPDAEAATADATATSDAAIVEADATATSDAATVAAEAEASATDAAASVDAAAPDDEATTPDAAAPDAEAAWPEADAANADAEATHVLTVSETRSSLTSEPANASVVVAPALPAITIVAVYEPLPVPVYTSGAPPNVTVGRKPSLDRNERVSVSPPSPAVGTPCVTPSGRSVMTTVPSAGLTSPAPAAPTVPTQLVGW